MTVPTRALPEEQPVSQPHIVRSLEALREVLSLPPGASIGFVPTMGALHDGHLELVRQSRAHNDVTVVSIFVNPSQFNSADDLARYPRNEARDVSMLADAGVNVVFAPTSDVMYPSGFCTWVTVEGLTDVLEGTFRPGHFRGVATVVTLLLHMVRPQRAYFGEKDWQQLLVIRQLARDLRLDVEIVGVPTVREPDGVAMSSRNARLDHGARSGARIISGALAAAQAAYAGGEHHLPTIELLLRTRLSQEPALTTEYAVIVDATTLQPPLSANQSLRALIAAHIGGVRLIDNIAIG